MIFYIAVTFYNIVYSTEKRDNETNNDFKEKFRLQNKNFEEMKKIFDQQNKSIAEENEKKIKGLESIITHKDFAITAGITSKEGTNNYLSDNGQNLQSKKHEEISSDRTFQSDINPKTISSKTNLQRSSKIKEDIEKSTLADLEKIKEDNPLNLQEKKSKSLNCSNDIDLDELYNEKKIDTLEILDKKSKEFQENLLDETEDKEISQDKKSKLDDMQFFNNNNDDPKYFFTKQLCSMLNFDKIDINTNQNKNLRDLFSKEPMTKNFLSVASTDENLKSFIFQTIDESIRVFKSKTIGIECYLLEINLKILKKYYDNEELAEAIEKLSLSIEKIENNIRNKESVSKKALHFFSKTSEDVLESEINLKLRNTPYSQLIMEYINNLKNFLEDDNSDTIYSIFDAIHNIGLFKLSFSKKKNIHNIIQDSEKDLSSENSEIDKFDEDSANSDDSSAQDFYTTKNITSILTQQKVFKYLIFTSDHKLFVDLFSKHKKINRIYFEIIEFLDCILKIFNECEGVKPDGKFLTINFPFNKNKITVDFMDLLILLSENQGYERLKLLFALIYRINSFFYFYYDCHLSCKSKNNNKSRMKKMLNFIKDLEKDSFTNIKTINYHKIYDFSQVSYIPRFLNNTFVYCLNHFVHKKKILKINSKFSINPKKKLIYIANKTYNTEIIELADQLSDNQIQYNIKTTANIVSSKNDMYVFQFLNKNYIVILN